MTALASGRRFSAVVLRQIARDRVALFFMVGLPVVVIVVIGLTFGSAGTLGLGVVDESGGSTTAQRIVDALDSADGTTVVAFDSLDELRRAVRRQSVAAGVVLPAGVDDALTAGDLAVRFVTPPAGAATGVARDVLVSAVARVAGPADAARLAAELTGSDPVAAQQVATELAPTLPPVTVETVDVGRSTRSGLNEFSLVAPQQMVLFVFINALVSGAALVRMRRTGVLRRVLAGPGGAGSIITGVFAAWLLVSLLQSALLLTIGALLFDVDWGRPAGVAALAAVFSAVGAGAGLLVGAVGGNEDRVGAITPPIGLVLGALGGCMVPLEVFSPTMRGVAHAVPHYWAITAWQQLVFDGDGLAEIAGRLAVLLGFAFVFVTLAASVLRRALLRG